MSQKWHHISVEIGLLSLRWYGLSTGHSENIRQGLHSTPVEMHHMATEVCIASGLPGWPFCPLYFNNSYPLEDTPTFWNLWEVLLPEQVRQQVNMFWTMGTWTWSFSGVGTPSFHHSLHHHLLLNLSLNTKTFGLWLSGWHPTVLCTKPGTWMGSKVSGKWDLP